MAEEKKTKKVKSTKSKVKTWIERLIVLVALCVFVYAAFNIFLIKKDNYQETREIDSIREEMGVDKKSEEEFKIDFADLKEKNPDAVGWLIVKDTEISYPVAKGSDNDFYLTHTFMKSENYAGAIFMDYRAKQDLSGYNTFIYGHNVKHGSMFAELENYMSKDFFEKHPYVYYYTETGSYKLQVYSAYQDKGDSASFANGGQDLQTAESYGNYLNYVKGLSKYDSGVTMTPEDHMVTLYTCSYEGATDGEYVDERYYIHLKIIEAMDGEMPYGEPV